MDNQQIPAEIADARDLAATAASNLAAAEDREAAAKMDLAVAAEKATAAAISREMADRAEECARLDYIDTLRRHGYVQTADGPRPAAEANAR